jgi:hypothetical protein
MADDYGNSTTTAGTLAVGTPATGNIEERYDEDWFGIDLQAGTTYWLEVLGAKSSAGTAGSPHASLYDYTGAYISGVAAGGPNGDTLLAYTPLVSGIHYVAAAVGGLEGGTYTVRATVAPVADDFRGDAATSAALAIGGQVSGNLEVPTDWDWFKAELVAGATYAFELRGVDGGGGTAGGGAFDLSLRVAHASGLHDRGSSNGGAGGDPLLTYTALESGTHYVKVSSQRVDSTGSGTYTVNAAQVPSPVNFIGGTDGNDVLHASAGSDLIVGGAGRDVVVYPGPVMDYTMSLDRFTQAISIGDDTLHGVERVHFDNVGRAFDIVDGNAGIVAKTLGAVFGGDSVQNRDYVAIGLTLVDGGMGYEDVMQYALDRALGPDADSTAIVNLLYGNVMRHAPPAEALDFYTGLLDSGEVSSAWLGVYAAETVYNLINTLGVRPAEYPLFFTIG